MKIQDVYIYLNEDKHKLLEIVSYPTLEEYFMIIRFE